ncbi:hypothetical protein Mesil_2195 [Allomeiothermus silvanus DSM 9946]|uniref:Uncharacterized protein n=1 Tax=Allomeiothermus silvanus (strain ATCC 700542 / DSM 9946 / NBRC 106475 / NCIMB 13440 / VI-R2) TaxID=526227 RepID=D7BFZ2_ALLS1|nr:helix-turn-helix domain-containing protein [Allomeiothermus silvanus]ADH63695.1 hypothetical protein Mesil_1818 [Allomeiothermus silvanus DSM 9946]ADH64065.1 hypothetical protein Mesil_2195 [Allomeiothermus silvanus DSM 9946]
MTVVNHLTLEQLQHRIKQEKDPIAQLRFLAVYPAQKGLGAQEIAQLTTRTPRWVHATLQRYNPQGPQALSDRRHTNPGRRPKLRPEESAQVHKAHRPMAVFGRARNCGSGWRWRLSLNPIYRPGYRLKVPRPVHRKGDPAAQEANLCQRVEAARAEGGAVRVFAYDEHRLGLKPVLPKVWARQGERPRASGTHGSTSAALWNRRAGPA